MGPQTSIYENHLLITVLENFGNVLNGDVEGHSKYYFLPFWFEKAPDGKLIMHNLESLPENLKHRIEKKPHEIHSIHIFSVYTW